MKILFEGTEEQKQNLLELYYFGDNFLPQIKTNYQIENLWSTEDVKSLFKCTDDQAMEVLVSALTNPATIEYIWDVIKDTGYELGLTQIEDDE